MTSSMHDMEGSGLAMKKAKKKIPAKRGPKPKLVKIEGNWEGALGQALKKKRPKAGWPKRDKL